MPERPVRCHHPPQLTWDSEPQLRPPCWGSSRRPQVEQENNPPLSVPGRLSAPEPRWPVVSSSLLPPLCSRPDGELRARGWERAVYFCTITQAHSTNEKSYPWGSAAPPLPSHSAWSLRGLRTHCA